MDGLETRPVIPQHIVLLRQARKIGPCMPELVFIGPVQADNHPVDVIGTLQLVDNRAQCLPL